MVVNCAAYTDVDGAEDDLEGASRINAEGARLVALGAAEVGASVVYPSTDYVFDGRKGEPYVESDATRPLSIYGQTKAAGEAETAAANQRYYIVRSSWLFGTRGQQLRRDDARARRRPGRRRRRPRPGRLPDLHRAPGRRARAADRHERVRDPPHRRRRRVLVVRVRAGDLPAGGARGARDVDDHRRSCRGPAPRPPYSVLATERAEAIYLPDWQEGLASYLAERAAVAA